MDDFEKASTVIRNRVQEHQAQAKRDIDDACQHEHTAKKRRERAETHMRAAKELGEMLKTVEAAERIGGFVDSVLAANEAETAAAAGYAMRHGVGTISIQAEGDAISMKHVDIRAGDARTAAVRNGRLGAWHSDIGADNQWDRPISADLLSNKDRE